MSESQMVHLRIRGEDGKMHPITYFHGDKGDKGDIPTGVKGHLKARRFSL